MPEKVGKDQIMADIKWGKSDDSIVLFIPDKDKKSVPIMDQAQWAEGAAELFARLYGGSTGYKNLLGTWYDSKSGTLIAEQPIMIQALTKRENLEDPEKLDELLTFCKRMGKKTNQACIGLAINDVFYYISDYAGA
jgi:hypothetical protein